MEQSVSRPTDCSLALHDNRAGRTLAKATKEGWWWGFKGLLEIEFDQCERLKARISRVGLNMLLLASRVYAGGGDPGQDSNSERFMSLGQNHGPFTNLHILISERGSQALATRVQWEKQKMREEVKTHWQVVVVLTDPGKRSKATPRGEWSVQDKESNCQGSDFQANRVSQAAVGSAISLESLFTPVTATSNHTEAVPRSLIPPNQERLFMQSLAGRETLSRCFSSSPRSSDPGGPDSFGSNTPPPPPPSSPPLNLPLP
ncbi:unnamed protein product [Pleuronectes platessa]|uniref:Uncharacterized protein n=1 Tax=Pleuronectes platessa TaxID=8262 RepID=A0A9N7UC44_PLEPL|nr:unnamed protein product [Pleuronectes platessa]